MVAFDGYGLPDPFFVWQGLADYELESRAVARTHFRHFVAVRGARREELARLVAQDGVELGASEPQLLELEAWFRGNVRPDPERAGVPSVEWCAVAFDIGTFLGDALIERASGFAWRLFVEGRKNIDYLQPVVRGFYPSGVRYDVNYYGRISGLAVRELHRRGSIPEGVVVESKGMTIDITKIFREGASREEEMGKFQRWLDIPQRQVNGTPS